MCVYPLATESEGIFPSPDGDLCLTIGIRNGNLQLVRHTRPCVSDVRKISLIRHSRRIKFVATKLSPIKHACNTRYEFVTFRFDPDHKIISCNCPLSLSGEFHFAW
jgi:hypothetical protein